MFSSVGGGFYDLGVLNTPSLCNYPMTKDAAKDVFALRVCFYIPPLPKYLFIACFLLKYLPVLEMVSTFALSSTYHLCVTIKWRMTRANTVSLCVLAFTLPPPPKYLFLAKFLCLKCFTAWGCSTITLFSTYHLCVITKWRMTLRKTFLFSCWLFHSPFLLNISFYCMFSFIEMFYSVGDGFYDRAVLNLPSLCNYQMKNDAAEDVFALCVGFYTPPKYIFLLQIFLFEMF